CSVIFAAQRVPEDRKALQAMVHRRHSGDENLSPQAQTLLRYVAAAHKQGGRRKRGRSICDKTLTQAAASAAIKLCPEHVQVVQAALVTCHRPAITSLIRAGYQDSGSCELDTTLVTHDTQRIRASLDPWLVPVLQQLIVSYVNFADMQVGVRLCDYPKL